MKKIFIVESSPKRLDIFLSDSLKKTRNQIQGLVKTGGVKINNAPATKAGIALKMGDKIEVEIKEICKDSSAILDKQNLEFLTSLNIEILYENDDILVINKPPNLVVHAAPSVKEPTLVDWLKIKNYTLSALNGKERAGIIHRIDKQTSGALCIAKNNAAHELLSAQLKDKSMGRIYLAIIDLPLKNNAIVESKIARNPNNRLKMKSYPLADFVTESITESSAIFNAKNSAPSKIPPSARYAKSHFINLAHSSDSALIAVKLFTGRTHQIRAQLEMLNRHILGDALYGSKTPAPRIMLHAKELYLNYKGAQIEVSAPIFADMLKCLQNYPKESYNENLLPYFT